MAAKKKDVRRLAPSAPPVASQQIAALYVPERSKATRMIAGSPAEAAEELVRRLREEARAL
jgi:electron transfer flavoprotein alpha/beta subunit